MKPKPSDLLERMRLLAFELEEYGQSGVGTMNGVFGIKRKGVALRIIASAGEDEMDGQRWEHVSVSTPNRCPTWEEMCFVKDLFWSPDECVIQFHPPASVYVNQHPFCLHLWRPVGMEIPTPPMELVGEAA